MLKDKIINKIIEVEGGYTNDSSDSGGETNFGITKQTARAYGFTGNMIDLSREVAFSIYQDKYWDSVKASQIIKLSSSITEELVDTAVNCGPGRSGKFLQRSLNVLNDKEKYFGDIVVDGRIGKMTIDALKQYLDVREESVLLTMLNVLQGSFYIKLAESREKDEKFLYGWIRSRVII